MMKSDVCSNCRYFKSNNDDAGGGQCRRYPPTPILAPQQNLLAGHTTLGVMAVHPPVNGDHSCGEYSETEYVDPALSTKCFTGTD